MAAWWPSPAKVPRSSGGMSGMPHGEAFDVDLVHHRVRVPVPGPLVVLPAERWVDDQAAGHVPGRVQGGGPAGVGRVLAEHLRPERHRTRDRLGVGVEQQFGRVAPQPPGGSQGPSTR